MRIIICGAGRAGLGIARQLSDEHRDVTVIDHDDRVTSHALQNFDVLAVTGNAGHPSVLREAGIDGAEMIVAVTSTDEMNMIICQIAHSLFDVPVKIARVRSAQYLNPAWSHMFTRDNIPIDLVMSPERKVSQTLARRIETPAALVSSDFAGGSMRLLGFDVAHKSPLRDTYLEKIGDLFPDFRAHLVGVGRGEELLAAGRVSQICQGDRLYWVCPTDHIARLHKIMGLPPESDQRRTVVIVGGGRVGLDLASTLERRRQDRIRMIERNPAAAEHAAEVLNRVVVLHGDGLNPELLAEAGAEEADMVVALTESDRTNLIACAQAKYVGASFTLALIGDPMLARLHRGMGVDAVIDPRATTVSDILLLLRKGRFVGLQSLENGRGEIIEGVTMQTSPLIGKSMSDSLPAGIAAGAALRDDRLIELDQRIRDGDHIIMFSERASIAKLERLFRVSPDFF